MASDQPDRASIARYYDGHAAEIQQRVGVNLRHRSILRRLVRAGLKSDHRVLEIGCGIGTLTGLIARRASRGSVLAIDISDKAVEMARAHLAGHRHVRFLVSDMSTFAVDERYNFIVLPDVLEHIPEATHERLFGILRAHLAPGGCICIHIPDPQAQEWLRKERPEALQIVDQSLAIAPMVERFARLGVILDRFERYSLWTREPDYDWIEFRLVQEGLQQTSYSYARRVLNELRSRLRQ